MRFLILCLLSITFSKVYASDPVANKDDPVNHIMYQNYTYNSLQGQICYHQHNVDPYYNQRTTPEIQQQSHTILVQLFEAKLQTINLMIWQINHPLFNLIPIHLHHNPHFAQLKNMIFNQELVLFRLYQNYHFFTSQELEQRKHAANIRNNRFSYQEFITSTHRDIQSAGRVLCRYHIQALYMMEFTCN